MCYGAEAAWVPAAIAAVGAGATAYSTDEARKQKDEALLAGMETQSLRQDEADAAVNAQLEQLKTSNSEAERAQAADAFVSQLRKSRAQAEGASTAGATSDAFKRDTATAAQDVSQFGTKAANVLARINAPIQQRQREGVQTGRLGQQLSVISRNAGGDDFLTQLRAGQARPNPWVAAGGEVAQGVGQGMASNGYGQQQKPVKFNPKTAGDYNLTGATRGFA